jgi:hypothetical protein
LKEIKDFGFVPKQIDPFKFIEIIDDANIVLFIAKGVDCVTPKI